MSSPKPNITDARIWIPLGIGALMAMVILSVGLVALRPGPNRASGGATPRPPTAAEKARALAMEIASEPVAVSKSSVTAMEVNRRRRALRERDYVEAYAKSGPRQQPWDAEARAFLSAWLDQDYGGGEKGVTNMDLAEAGDHLANEGADDPIVLTVASTTEDNPAEARRRLQQAMAGFVGSTYGAYPQFFARLALERLQSGAAATNEDAAALVLFKKALEDGSVTATEQDDVAESLVNGWGAPFFTRNAAAVCEVVNQKPAFVWLDLALHGAAQIAAAWQARGSGPTNKLSAAAWQTYADDMGKARNELTGAWKLHPEWPLPCAQMMSVCLAEKKLEEDRQWFERAVAGQFDYMPAWAGMRWALRVRWGGSVEAERAFGLTALQTGRFDTDVPYEMLRAVTDMEFDLLCRVGEHIYGDADIWPHLQRMSEGYIEEAAARGDAEAGARWRGNYADLAYLAGDFKAARQQLEATDWRTPPWGTSWGRDISLLVVETAARTGPAAAGVSAAENARTNGKTAEALADYLKLEKTPGLDGRSARFIAERVASLQMQRALEGGEAVDFLPAADDDPNWVTARGTFTRNADGSVDLKGGPEGAAIYCHTPTGENFDLTAEFDVIGDEARGVDFQTGLLLGWPDPRGTQWWGFSVKQDATGGQAALAVNWEGGAHAVTHRATLLRQGNKLDFRLAQGLATATVNGAPVCHEARGPGRILVAQGEFGVGLGIAGAKTGRNAAGDGVVIRWRNVKLRRVPVK